MDKKYKIGANLSFCPKSNLLTDDSGQGEEVTLGSNESRLLLHLIENNDRAVSRKELIETLWNDRDIFVDDSSLTQSVSTLRKALKDSRRVPAFIKTVPKLGYEFIAAVEVVDPSVMPSGEKDYITNPSAHLKNISRVVGTIRPHVFVTSSMLLRFSLFNSLLLGAALLKPNTMSALVELFSLGLKF